MRTKKPKQIDYHSTVEPFIDKSVGVRGFNSAVTRHMSKIVGREMKRQQVEGWIHPDFNKRVEPGYSTALQLFEALRLASEEMKL